MSQSALGARFGARRRAPTRIGVPLAKIAKHAKVKTIIVESYSGLGGLCDLCEINSLEAYPGRRAPTRIGVPLAKIAKHAKVKTIIVESSGYPRPPDHYPLTEAATVSPERAPYRFDLRTYCLQIVLPSMSNIRPLLLSGHEHFCPIDQGVLNGVATTLASVSVGALRRKEQERACFIDSAYTVFQSC